MPNTGNRKSLRPAAPRRAPVLPAQPAHPAPRPVDFGDLPERLLAARSVIVFSHVGPDLDNIGAVLALASGLTRAGVPAVCAANADPVPRGCRFLPGTERIVPLPHARGPFDIALALDCSDEERPGFAGFRALAPHLVNLDHHIGNTGFADRNIVEPERTSTCELVALLLERLGERTGRDLIDRDAATCLFAGIMGDSIRFLTAGCTPELYRLVARLVERGADPQEIGTRAYMDNTLSGARVLAHALGRVESSLGGRFLHFTVTEELRARFGATMEDSAPVVNHLLAISGVETAAVFETEGATLHVNLRSKTRFDVGEIARELGGGGHMNAAGCQMAADPGAVERVVALVEERMRRSLDPSARTGTTASAAS